MTTAPSTQFPDSSSCSVEITGQSTLASFKKVEWRWRMFAALCGAITGLAAPGIEQWYLPWFSLSALILLTAKARDPWLASVRGYYFGTFYNLVYMSWHLQFRQEYSSGVFIFPLPVVNATNLILLAGMQGIFISLVPALIRCLPLTGGWLPVRHQGRWHLPGFVVWPLLWVLVDRMCNTTQLLGAPTTALHYTQYRQVLLLQSAALIGGVGISAWIVLVSANLAAWIGAGREELLSISCRSKMSLVLNTAVTLGLSIALICYGQTRLSQSAAGKKHVTVVALQANLSQVLHKCSAVKVVGKYLELSKRAPQNSICIWPEWSFPVSFSKSPNIVRSLAVFATRQKQDWVVGLEDRGSRCEIYNAACAIDHSGRISSEAYRKRYLVPVGEYLPDWIGKTPIKNMLFGLNKLRQETSSGEKPVVLALDSAKIAPVICFEAAYPRLCAESIRAGGELMVDCSDNSWFKKSILSDQMVSFCVMRAVENHRSFVFATALGPSTIVDSQGRILAQAGREREDVIESSVPIENDLTPYTRWCF